MEKTFTDGAIIRMCGNCAKQGMDYQVFRLPNGNVFLMVYVDPKLKKS